MTEARPYTMIMMAVFGLISAFIYAREPNPPMSPDVEVAQSSPAATMVMPPQVERNFPAIATGSQPAVAAPVASPIPTMMPRGYVPPVATAVPMSPTMGPGGVVIPPRVPQPPVMPSPLPHN